MDSLIQPLITILSHGGPEVVAVLILAIALLLMDRKRLQTDLYKKEERIDKIVDDYHKGNITLAEALNSLKYVLVEVRSRIEK